jgi:hypothetical protein
MRAWIDDRVEQRHNLVRLYPDDTRRSNLLGGLDEGLLAMLQENQKHGAGMQTLRHCAKLKHPERLLRNKRALPFQV